jgi:type IV pilus assembly protein PilY1
VGYSSFFAIDVTNAGTTTDPEAEPKVLWEFSDPDMGFATTYPSIVRTGTSSANGRWYVVFGSGSKWIPKSGQDIYRSSTGFIFILDLKTGVLVKKIDLGHSGIVGDILAIDADKNYHSEALYFGTSLCSTTGYIGICDTGWTGKVMSIAVPPDVTLLCGSGTEKTYSDCTSGSNPPLVRLFEGNYPFTASPDAAKDEYGKVWVYAGSGKYFSDMDEEDVSQQIFFGLKHDPENFTYPVTEGNAATAAAASCPPGNELCDVTKNKTEGTVGSTVQVCAYNSTTGSFSLQDVVTTVASSSTAPKSQIGWKIYLPKDDTSVKKWSEKMITRPLAVGGLVDFLTYKPTGDACSYGGESFLYSVDYTSGVAPQSVAIRSPGATTTTAGATEVKRSLRLGPGAPPTGEAIIIAPPKDGKELVKKKIQIATGVIVEAENKPTNSTASKIMQCLEE